jgi:two-component system sensor histidine kinase UhpB
VIGGRRPRIQNVTETEKRQLSRELHDRVGQSTTTLALDLTILESVLPAEAVEAREWLAHSLAEVKQMTSAIRGVMHELRPPELDDYGLTAALQWYGQQFEQRSGLPVIIEAVELTPRLPLDTETALFRITQEAMTNILKHARAKRVTIALEQLAGGIRLTIADDGIGFVFPAADVARPSVQEGGWGLLTMRERSVAIGGNLTIASAASQGTRIIVDIQR